MTEIRKRTGGILPSNQRKHHGKSVILNCLAAAAAVCLALFLTACGKGGSADGMAGNTAGGNPVSGDTGGTASGQKQGWVYVPEVITVEDEHADYERMQLVGDTVCYVSQGEDTEGSEKMLCRYSLTEAELKRVPLDFAEGGENWDVGARCFDRDCNVYLTANVYPADYSSMTRFLCKFDAEGNCLFSGDITEQLGRGSALEGMSVDRQGRIYVFGNDGEILLYNGEGEYQATVSCGSSGSGSPFSVRVIGACDGADGKYYVCIVRESVDAAGQMIEGAGGEDTRCTLMEIDFEGVRLSEAAGHLPNIKGICAGSWWESDAVQEGEGEYDFLLYDDHAVYGFEFAAQKGSSGTAGEELFAWMDSDINGYCVTNLYLTEDGRLCATVEDWSNEDRAIVLLKKTGADQAPRREELVLATVDGESDLAAMAVKFNRGNSQYHLTVKNFASLTDLYNAVLTKEPMDLVDLSGIHVQKLTDQGVFENLEPYVEQSEAFGRSDFVDGILDVYTFGDTLAGIPASFTLRTVVGSRTRQEGQERQERQERQEGRERREGQEGQEGQERQEGREEQEKQPGQEGLTLEELLASAERHPEARAFDGMSRDELMQYLMMFNEDTFIDWSTGTCRFDSDTFQAVLQYVKQYPDAPKSQVSPENQVFSESDMEEASLPAKIRNGEVLYAVADLDTLRAFQEYEGMFGESAACIGFPTPDGEGGHILFTGDAYAIVSGSQHKEGAWKFIEGFLAQDKGESYYGNFLNTSFPTLKKTFNDKVEEAIAADSQYGSDKFPERIYSDGTTFRFRALTWDDVNVMLKLVPEAEPYFDAEGDEIIRIIEEEAAGYYSGQKGIQDVTKVIQNRVQLYVNENRSSF